MQLHHLDTSKLQNNGLLKVTYTEEVIYHLIKKTIKLTQ
jgi:hypothetical protein